MTKTIELDGSNLSQRWPTWVTFKSRKCAFGDNKNKPGLRFEMAQAVEENYEKMVEDGKIPH